MKEDWLNVSSGLILDIRDGTHNTPKYVNDSSHPLITSKNLKNGELDLSNIKYISVEEFEEINKRSKVDIGDVLFAMIGTIGNPVLIKKEPNYAIKNVGLFKNRLKVISSDFLCYYLDSSTFIKQLQDRRLLKGTTQKFIPLGHLRNINLPLPPLVEQQAIVNKIEEVFSSLDSGIADLKKAQDQLKIYRQAVLKKAFEGELTSTEINNKALEPYTDLITKALHRKWQGFDYTNDNSQLLFITSENVREGYISLEKEKYLPIGFNEVQKRSVLQNGDVLLNIVGASIGRAAIFELDKLSNINQAVCLIRLKDNELLKKYLCYYLNSETAKQDYLNKQVDVARANLSLTNVKELEIPYCKPAEQHQIVQEIESRLSVCDAIEQSIAESLDKAQALRQSILKKAFEGKLLSEEEIAKCKADKDYEPASVLLEKMKTEKKKK